jgi:hypothetical protein
MENVMSYVSENTTEVRILSASEIELIAGGMISVSDAIKVKMGLGGIIRAVAKKAIQAAERQ